MPQLIHKTRPDPLWLVVVLLVGSLPAQEVQQHGVLFEEWVRKEFFDGYAPASYTQKWDIPGAANIRFGGLPVNPKATKYGETIGLGDALRQFDISEPFILLLGFWQQDDDVKRFVNITPVTIHPETWRMMWGPVTREDLEKLDALIKDRAVDYHEVRKQARELKKQLPYRDSLIVLNPKIDSTGQRRLQCSLRFDHVFDLLATQADRSAIEVPVLWDVPFPGPIVSEARSFVEEAAP